MPWSFRITSYGQSFARALNTRIEASLKKIFLELERDQDKTTGDLPLSFHYDAVTFHFVFLDGHYLKYSDLCNLVLTITFMTGDDGAREIDFGEYESLEWDGTTLVAAGFKLDIHL